MSKTLAPSITHRDPKGRKFVSIVETAYDKANLSDEEAQRVNDTPGLAEFVGGFIARNRQADPRFELLFEPLADFKVAVPKNYDHATWLGSFAKKHRQEFYFYHDGVTDANFAKATQKLVPGKTYAVKIFGITQRVSSEDCLGFLKTQKAVLVGAQGLTLAWEQKKEQLPKGKWMVSFDEKDALPSLDGGHRVPYVHAPSGGDFRLNLGSFGTDWYVADCLLCFCDEE